MSSPSLLLIKFISQATCACLVSCYVLCKHIILKMHYTFTELLVLEMIQTAKVTLKLTFKVIGIRAIRYDIHNFLLDLGLAFQYNCVTASVFHRFPKFKQVM